MRTWVAVAIVSAFALFAVYVVGINVFLSTSLFEKAINQDPDTLFVSYERGWSIWPGRVHARRLTIRSSDKQVQFVLRIDTCDFTFGIADLALHKTFHVTRVEGSGITFQARQRIPAPAATPEYVDALPQIPGFERVPLPSLEPPDLLERWDDRHYHLWTVHLENVTAKDVREVWIDGVRWDGEARITGGFFLRPIRNVHVDDVHVDLREGRATALRRVVVESMAGTVDVDLDAFDPRGSPDLVHLLSLRTDLHGRSPDLANLPPRLLAPVKIAGPAEVRHLALNIAHGKLRAGTHVDVAAPLASIEVAGHRAAGDLAGTLGVADEAGGPRLTFDVAGRALTVTRLAEARGALVHAPSLEVTGDARALDLADPLRDLHAVVTLPDSELPDARLLQAYVPPSTQPTLSFEGGQARTRGRLELWLADRRANGEGSMDASALDLRVAKIRVRGSTTVSGSFDAWRWEARRIGDAKAKIAIAKGSIAREETPDRKVVEATALEVGLEAAEVDTDDPLRSFSATLRMPDAEIVDRALLRRYLPRGKDMQIARGHAHFDAQSELVVKDYRGAGSLLLHASRLGFTLEELSAFTDVNARARVHDWAWERGDLAIDEASVVLTNVDVKRTGVAASALVIPRIALHARSERFDVSDPLATLELAGTVQGGKVSDPIALNAFLPKEADLGFDTEPGSGRFEAALSAKIARHVARGSLMARGQGVGVRGEKVGIRGNVEASAEIEDWRMGAATLRVKSSRIAFDDVTVRFGERKPEGSAPPPDLVAKRLELSASVDTLDPVHPSLHGVDYRLILDDARMDDVRPLGLLFAGDPLAFAVESGKAHAAVDVTVRASNKTASGGARIALEGAGVRLHEAHLAGDFEVVAQVSGFDRLFDGVNVSGTKITMRNVSSVGANATTSAWNGEVNVLRGAVRVSDRPAFDAFVQLHADDANPILALALQNSLPKFAVGLLKAPELSGQARIVIEPGRFAILGAHLRGDDVALIGNYVDAGDHVRGAATVAKGPLSAGVKVDDQGTEVRLFRLDSWLKDEATAAQRLFGESKAKPR